MLSIKPKIVREIANGEKTFEFRKKLLDITDPKNGIDNRILIYTSSPDMQISGSFTAKQFYCENFDDLMEKVQATDKYRARIFNYFKHKNKCFAIKISDFKKYDSPLVLKYLRQQHNGFIPGQSYRYINKTDPIIEDIILKNGHL